MNASVPEYATIASRAVSSASAGYADIIAVIIAANRIIVFFMALSLLSWPDNNAESYRDCEFYRIISPIHNEKGKSIMAASFSHSYSSPLGEMTLHSDGENITALYFSDMLREGSSRATPIMIPCHRVIGSNGKLTGYSGGLPRKLKLLELEGVDIFQLSKH